MPETVREFYLSLARSDDPEPQVSGFEDFPIDLPDDWHPDDLPDGWPAEDWPDSPDPRVNDYAAFAEILYLAFCTIVTVASLAYLLSQVRW